MSTPRTALITGANQGLGFALARGLAARWTRTDRVLLTGRDPARVAAAARAAAGEGAVVDGHVLDVTDSVAIAALADEVGAEHGGIDVVFSNATARTRPDQAPASVVDATVDTSNLATTRMLRAFAPILRPGGSLIVVASSFGTLGHLDPRIRPLVAHAATLDAVDELTRRWQAAVHAGRAIGEGWGEWLNVPSKVLQVAAVRALAADRADADRADGTLIAAVCPGLFDTEASRPWFDDMRDAQTAEQAAVALLDLVTGPADQRHYGELIRFGQVLPFDAEIAPESTARARVTHR